MSRGRREQEDLRQDQYLDLYIDHGFMVDEDSAQHSTPHTLHTWHRKAVATARCVQEAAGVAKDSHVVDRDEEEEDRPALGRLGLPEAQVLLRLLLLRPAAPHGCQRGGPHRLDARPDEETDVVRANRGQAVQPGRRPLRRRRDGVERGLQEDGVEVFGGSGSRGENKGKALKSSPAGPCPKRPRCSIFLPTHLLPPLHVLQPDRIARQR